jgi:hypothetical protein
MLTTSPVGRDKLLRTIQYFSRFYAWYLYRTNNPQSAIAPWEAMKKQFGTTRKIMRLGKFVEHIKAAAVATDARGMDPVLRYCAIGRQLGYAAYMTLDNISAVSGPRSYGVKVGGSGSVVVKPRLPDSRSHYTLVCYGQYVSENDNILT